MIVEQGVSKVRAIVRKGGKESRMRVASGREGARHTCGCVPRAFFPTLLEGLVRYAEKDPHVECVDYILRYMVQLCKRPRKILVELTLSQ